MSRGRCPGLRHRCFIGRGTRPDIVGIETDPLPKTSAIGLGGTTGPTDLGIRPGEIAFHRLARFRSVSTGAKNLSRDAHKLIIQSALWQNPQPFPVLLGQQKSARGRNEKAVKSVQPDTAGLPPLRERCL